MFQLCIKNERIQRIANRRDRLREHHEHNFAGLQALEEKLLILHRRDVDSETVIAQEVVGNHATANPPNRLC